MKLDFEGTAYSKVFELDTTGKTFDQLRIILKPETFLNFPAPIGLYMNFGKEIPTKENYDMKGLTIWDDGLGIFLAQPEASGIFTFLIEGPEKNILILENKLVQLKKSNILIQQKPHFDYLAGDGEKIYTATVDHTKSNCLKISILSGAVKLEGIYDTKMKKINSTFVPLSRAYGELEYRLIPDYFKKNFPE